MDALALRHAPTSWNDEERRQGWADQPLTAEARQATREWAELACASFSAVVSSDLQRARESAEIIAATLGLGDVEVIPGLREQHQGAWTGLTKEQIRDRWPERLRERPRRPVDGESAETLLERVLAAFGQIGGAHLGECVLVVAHSGVIHALERAARVEAPPVPHLEGRWFRVLATSDRDRCRPVEWLLAGELTAGRRRLNARAAAAPLFAEPG